MIFLSIIIPHYNLPSELLMRCVKSIIDQKMSDGSYEVIVVDDGSEEPPRWLSDTFDSKHVHLLEIEHLGPGGARNAGLKAAQGRYIQFIDADDCLQPDSLLPCLQILDNEEPQILRFHYKICHSERAALDNVSKKAIKTSNTISGAMYMSQANLSGSPCTYIFERTLALKNNVWFETNVYHEDEEFNTKLHYFASTLIDTDAVIYNYCIRKESITSNSNPKFEEKRIEDLFSLLERLTEFRRRHSDTCNSIQRQGLDHKMTMLTVDTILNLLFNNYKAKKIIDLCNRRLRPLSLYPLPPARYKLKYRIFRMLANSRAGMHLLRLLVSRKKPLKK